MNTQGNTPTLTLHEAAEELGVHYMTAYRYVRLGVLPATREGRSWVIAREDLDHFRSDDQPKPARGDTKWDDRLLNRMLAKDDSGAWGVVEAAMASGVTAPEVYTTMIARAMQEIGERWDAGDIDVADEHAAGQIAGRLMARLSMRMTTRGVRRGTIVLGSTSTERHDLPIMMLADLLRAERFDVVNLGASLPPSSFATAIEGADDVVVAAIGVTAPGQGDEIAATVSAIREVSDVPLLIGGGGITPAEALALGATASATSGPEAIAAVNRLVEDSRSTTG